MANLELGGYARVVQDIAQPRNIGAVVKLIEPWHPATTVSGTGWRCQVVDGGVLYKVGGVQANKWLFYDYELEPIDPHVGKMLFGDSDEQTD